MKSYINVVIFYLTAILPFLVSALPHSYKSSHQAILPISLSWTISKDPLAVTQLKYITQSVKAVQTEVQSITYENNEITVPNLLQSIHGLTSLMVRDQKDLSLNLVRHIYGGGYSDYIAYDVVFALKELNTASHSLFNTLSNTDSLLDCPYSEPLFRVLKSFSKASNSYFLVLIQAIPTRAKFAQDRINTFNTVLEQLLERFESKIDTSTTADRLPWSAVMEQPLILRQLKELVIIAHATTSALSKVNKKNARGLGQSSAHHLEMWNQRTSEMAHDLSITASKHAYENINTKTLVSETQTYYQTTQSALTTIEHIIPYLAHKNVDSTQQTISTLRQSSDAYFRVLKDFLSPIQIESVSRYLDDISDLMKRACDF